MRVNRDGLPTITAEEPRTENPGNLRAGSRLRLVPPGVLLRKPRRTSSGPKSKKAIDPGGQSLFLLFGGGFRIRTGE